MSRASYAELDPLSVGRIQDKRRLAEQLRAMNWGDLGALFDRFADRDEAELVTRIELQRVRDGAGSQPGPNSEGHGHGEP